MLAYLDIPPGQAEKLVAANVIPCRKVGGRNLFRTNELDDWLDGYYEGPPRVLSQLRAVP